MPCDKYFLNEGKPVINPQALELIVRHALIEDIGRGDITTQLTIPRDKEIRAAIAAKEEFLVCGLAVCQKVFNTVDAGVKFQPKIKEGKIAAANKILAIVSGKAGSILTAERVSLNLLAMLCAIATKTREYVLKIAPYKTKITDTRKTFPGLRELSKYAVRIGGGYNHRLRLDEMILIKDNHIKAADGYSKLPSVPKGYKIEVEAQNLDEFKHALKFKPDVIMLDNMGLKDIRKAVKIRNHTEFLSHHLPTKLEASGGINLKNVRSFAACGVEIISIGELTDSIKSVDLSLDVI